MFPFCAEPKTLEGLQWISCYVTTGKHFAFYSSFGTVMLLLLITAPVALLFGFGGATAARSTIAPLRWFGKGYTAIVRGIPDIAFFLFFVIALDQAFEYVRHKVLCPEWTEPVRQGNDFVVCSAAKLPLSSSPQWMHETYGFLLAVLTFAIVFGALPPTFYMAACVRYRAANWKPEKHTVCPADRFFGAFSCRKCGFTRCPVFPTFG